MNFTTEYVGNAHNDSPHMWRGHDLKDSRSYVYNLSEAEKREINQALEDFIGTTPKTQP
jgi:hypothetical protein